MVRVEATNRNGLELPTFHADREVEFSRPGSHAVPMTPQIMLYLTDVRKALLKAIVE